MSLVASVGAIVSRSITEKFIALTVATQQVAQHRLLRFVLYFGSGHRGVTHPAPRPTAINGSRPPGLGRRSVVVTAVPELASAGRVVCRYGAPGLSAASALRRLDSSAVASIRLLDAPNLAMDPICDYKKRS
jgi:hypothetical protein